MRRQVHICVLAASCFSVALTAVVKRNSSSNPSIDSKVNAKEIVAAVRNEENQANKFTNEVLLGDQVVELDVTVRQSVNPSR